MYQINDKEKHLCKAIVDAAYQVHRHLGPGLLEKIYVEEGVYVSEGAPLFRINSNEYQEQANSADASIHSAKASGHFSHQQPLQFLS